MEKVDFERLFDEEMAAPLASLGFRAVGRSLHAIVADAEVALIRLGGRMAGLPGAINHLLCVRKVWLRTLDDCIPDKFVREPFSYPFKLRPSSILKDRGLRYTPQNLNYSYDTLEFATEIPGVASAEVREELQELRSVIAERVVPWASALSAKELLKELKKRGEGAWIERLWIDDCQQRIAPAAAQPAVAADGASRRR
jgi:hypothetical protein